MPKYRYKALNETGETIEGILEGNNTRAIRETLRDKGHYMTELAELAEKGAKKDIEFSVKIPVSDLAIFCNQFAVVLKAGVSILQALDIMSSQTENPKLRKVLIDVYKKIQRGISITEAFKDHEKRFPELFISMLEAGEASGNLDLSLARMGNALTKEYKLNQKIKSAMTYPLILSIVAVLVVIFLLVFVVPTFTGMYAGSGQELPGLTRMVIGLGDFMSQYFLIIFLAIFTVILVIRMVLRSEDVRYSFDRTKLRLPVMGKLLVKIVTARFTQSMATLLVSGIPLPQAIDITSRSVGNAFISKHVKNLNSEVRAGRGLYEPLKEIGVFPPMVIQMVQLGEASGTLDDLLSKTAVFYEDEAEVATTRLTALIEPVIIFVMGGLILTIVLSILLPMFGMFSLIA